MVAKVARCAGLKLSEADLADVAGMKRHNAMKERTWRRIRILELLDAGTGQRAAGRMVGCWPREVRRVGRRYLEGGLVKAPSDDARPSPEPLLDHRQESALVAMVCSDCPEERGRWTVRLIAEEAGKRGIVTSISRESVRRLLQRHELKPWRKKNVVRTKA